MFSKTKSNIEQWNELLLKWNQMFKGEKYEVEGAIFFLNFILFF